MRNKTLLLILIALLVLALVGCIPGITPTPEPEEPVEVLSADVIVIAWEQQEPLTDVIIIDYLITNTGTIDIDFSKILFKVIYKDIEKDIYMVWLDGIGVKVGCYESGHITEVWVGKREVADVVAVDWELISYE